MRLLLVSRCILQGMRLLRALLELVLGIRLQIIQHSLSLLAAFAPTFSLLDYPVYAIFQVHLGIGSGLLELGVLLQVIDLLLILVLLLLFEFLIFVLLFITSIGNVVVILAFAFLQLFVVFRRRGFSSYVFDRFLWNSIFPLPRFLIFLIPTLV
jgi:hypothetical protein